MQCSEQMVTKSATQSEILFAVQKEFLDIMLMVTLPGYKFVRFHVDALQHLVCASLSQMHFTFKI